MPLSQKQKAIALVTEADIAELQIWGKAEYHLAKSNESSETLIALAVKERWSLSQATLRTARRLANSNNPDYRNVIGRFYYAMYQGARTTAFAFYKGDDHEAHTKLQIKLPGSIPNATHLKHQLKDARLTRNKADYELFPKTNAAWKSDADRLGSVAPLFLGTLQAYLIQRGWLN